MQSEVLSRTLDERFSNKLHGGIPEAKKSARFERTLHWYLQLTNRHDHQRKKEKSDI